MLAHDVEGTGPRLVLVHGFTQTRAHWGLISSRLAVDHEVVRVDAPGHGRSSELTADMADGAELLGTTAGHATYIGYSMGGRLCLHLALTRPDLVRGLVLVGATAGIEEPVERAQRVAADEKLAQRLEADGVDSFLAWWLGQPLFVGLDEEAADVGARRENTAAGLAASLRRAGTGAQEPLWDQLGRLAMPVLVVAGENDGPFATVAGRLAGSIGDNAELVLVPGAGHSAHLEEPARFLDRLAPWLGRHGL